MTQSVWAVKLGSTQFQKCYVIWKGWHFWVLQCSWNIVKGTWLWHNIIGTRFRKAYIWVPQHYLLVFWLRWVSWPPSLSFSTWELWKRKKKSHLLYLNRLWGLNKIMYLHGVSPSKCSTNGHYFVSLLFLLIIILLGLLLSFCNDTNGYVKDSKFFSYEELR